MKPPQPTMTPQQEAAWMQGKRIKPPAPPLHGLNGYDTYGCRCPICSAARRAIKRAQRDTELGISSHPLKERPA